MPLAAACALMMLAALAALPAVAAEDAVTAAHALLSAWHEDPARIDRARALLETAAAANPTPGDTLTELSRVWFLTGDFRARSEAERVTAYERGMEAGERAIAPRRSNDRGPSVARHQQRPHRRDQGREARACPGRHDPRGVGHRAEDESVQRGRTRPGRRPGRPDLPVMMGGDTTRPRRYFKRALEIDPRQTGAASSWPGSTSPTSAGSMRSASCKASSTSRPPRTCPGGR